MQIFKTFKKPKDILVVFALILVAGFVFWQMWIYYYHLLPQQVLIITKRPIYHSNEELNLAIKNVLPNNVCFSSCYPYYLEIKMDKWRSYEYYEECPHPDLIDACISPGFAKYFSVILPDLSPGLHRIRVPVVSSGKVGEDFEIDKIYYSNEFIVK